MTASCLITSTRVLIQTVMTEHAHMDDKKASDSPFRKRRFSHKVKSGCQTCKIRRTKCDETKPSCRKCVSTGRKCDGYVVQSQAQTQTQPQRMILVFNSQDTSNEKQAFHMFRSCTVDFLAGLLDAAFWKRDLLVAAEGYRPVRYAVIGLATAYQSFTKPDCTTPSQRDFVTHQYLKSMMLLNSCISSKQPSAESKVIILMVNLLLRALCLLQGLDREACLHLRGGLALLRQWNLGGLIKPSTPESSVHAIRFLEAAYTQLDTQARLLICTNTRTLSQPWESHDISLDGWGTGYLGAVTKAFSQIVQLHNRVMQSIGGQDAYSGKLRLNQQMEEEYRQQLNLWEEKFGGLLKDKASGESAAIVPIRICQLLVCAMISPSSLDYHERCCRELLNLVSTALATSTCQKGKPSFKFVGNWIESLFYISANSTVPETRLEAISLLEAYPLQEGMWAGKVAASVARRSILSTPADICRSSGQLLSFPMRTKTVNRVEPTSCYHPIYKLPAALPQQPEQA